MLSNEVKEHIGIDPLTISERKLPNYSTKLCGEQRIELSHLSHLDQD